jgi:hypothetical protein
MAEIYCSECGTKLEYVLDSDDYIVKPCPNCTHAECYWRSVKDDPPRPNYEVLVCWDIIADDYVKTAFRFFNHEGKECWMRTDSTNTCDQPDWWMKMPKAHDVVDETFGKYKGTLLEVFKENE